MKIIDKIKGFFFEAKSNADKRLESFIKPVEEAPSELVIQPKGELIGNCILCHVAIGSEDKTKMLNGVQVHKRCAKRAVKNMLNGKGGI